ncbi:hypothetical protein GTY86_18040 [Streptomyces sp. SID5770]|nr:hypothetical protein [Streptomyces sp. SID5770]MZE53143.1 hypothetical protein [Streptomyces sp. SID5770]
MGTWCFHNDGPVTDQRVTVLAPVTTGSPSAVAGIGAGPGQRGLSAA